MAIRINDKFIPSQWCFFVFWCMLMLGKGFGLDATDHIFRLMTWVGIAFAAAKLILTKWDRRSLICCVVINVLGILIFLKTRTASVLLTCLAITAMKDIDLGRVFRVSFWIRALTFAVRVGLAILGIMDKGMQYRWENGVMTVRYGLGYGHANATQYTLFIILALAILIYRNRLRWHHFLGMFCANLVLFFYTDSRTGFLMITLLLGLAFLMTTPRASRWYKWLRIAAINAFWVGAVFSIVTALLSLRVGWLNEMGTLSARFLTSRNIMLAHSVPLLGIEGITTDFGYINILYADGIIFWGLFIAGYTALAYKLDARTMIFEYVVLLCYGVYVLSEAYNDSVLMNVSLLLLPLLIYTPTGAYRIDAATNKIQHRDNL